MNHQREKAPILLYDGDCEFCKHWILRWSNLTRTRVRYSPYQQVLSEYPQVTRSQCEHAVQLVMADGSILSGAHAIFKALDQSGKFRLFLRLYETLPPFAFLSELVYQIVAHNRTFLSRF